MKIRNGFVSNSSSSSFIIGIKGKELGDSELLKVFKIGEDSPMYGLAETFAKLLVISAKPIGYMEVAKEYFKEKDLKKL